MPILQGKMTRTTPVTKTTSTTPVSPLILQHHQNIDLYVEKDVIHRNLNPAASGTSGQSRNDDSTLSRNDDSTLKESSESGSCGDDTLKRSYRSVLIGVGK